MKNEAVTISRNGFEVAPLSPRTAKIMWNLALRGPRTQATNVKTANEWCAMRHHFKTRSTNALTIAAKAASDQFASNGSSMVYILHADDKVSRVMIDWKGKVRVSSAYPG